MPAGGLAGQDWRSRRLDGHHEHFRLEGFQSPANAGYRAAGGHARHQGRHLSVRVRPDFVGRAGVGRRVGRVLELGRAKDARQSGGQVFGLFDGASHALLCGCEHHFGAEGAQHGHAPFGNELRHGQNEAIAPQRADDGQREAHVAAGGFDYHCVGVQQAGLLGLLDNGEGNAVFLAPARVVPLQLGRQPHGQVRPQPIQVDQGRIPDQFQRVLSHRCHVFRSRAVCTGIIRYPADLGNRRGQRVLRHYGVPTKMSTTAVMPQRTPSGTVSSPTTTV